MWLCWFDLVGVGVWVVLIFAIVLFDVVMLFWCLFDVLFWFCCNWLFTLWGVSFVCFQFWRFVFVGLVVFTNFDFVVWYGVHVLVISVVCVLIPFWVWCSCTSIVGVWLFWDLCCLDLFFGFTTWICWLPVICTLLVAVACWFTSYCILALVCFVCVDCFVICDCCGY